MGSEELGYFFENKEGLKLLGFFPSKDTLVDSPYSFYYQSFEGDQPEIINCSLILLQKQDDLWVYEKEGLEKTYQENFAPLLDREPKGERDLSAPLLKESPSLETWRNRVNEALEEIHSFESPISKIVLARSLELKFPEKISVKDAFLQLKKYQNRTFNILFPLNENDHFFSFTPERILMSNGKQTFFEAIAGTKPRGSTLEEENAFEKELLESKKEAHEHQEVVEQIANCVGQFGTLKIGKREVLKLRGIQHLKTPLQVNLKEAEKEAQLQKLAMALHPTPAVGGTPQEKAKNFIFKSEGVRGPYAGLFGILSPEHTEIAVLIRGGTISDNKLKAFAGAGIVEGSNAESEWNETKQKFKSFLGDLV